MTVTQRSLTNRGLASARAVGVAWWVPGQGGGYPGYGVWYSGAYLGGAPWYGSGVPLYWVPLYRPLYSTVPTTVFPLFDTFLDPTFPDRDLETGLSSEGSKKVVF